jgi:hypothetical protein
MSDVLQQTREANLYAPTGTRNYWMPETIQYAQGSDHDVFLGLGIPATMFGHDPDWTHHTSEDKIDKTDSTEFKRVGAFASTTGYWIAAADGEQWDRLRPGEITSRMEELGRRIASDVATGPTPAATRRININESNLQNAAKAMHVASRHYFEAFTTDPRVTGAEGKSDIHALLAAPSKTGPHRLTLLPLDASAFEAVSAEDTKWLTEQEARFASDSEGLATKPNFALISFEAVNFMDGRRGTAEIADLLSAEYLLDIDQAWVDRLVSILEKQKLVAK